MVGRKHSCKRQYFGKNKLGHQPLSPNHGFNPAIDWDVDRRRSQSCKYYSLLLSHSEVAHRRCGCRWRTKTVDANVSGPLQRNLPNKRNIGKQDPYCTLKLHNDTKRTKAVKRGGQHPEWDEEIRFELHEDIEDELARTARQGASSPPAPPPKDQHKERKVQGGKKMRVLCYADDPREPELIGETLVDLTEVLSKGETDGKSRPFLN